MNPKSKLTLAIGVLCLACVIVPSSLRADTFDWTYISGDATASGQLTTVPDTFAGILDLSAISGTFNGLRIDGLDNNIHDSGSTVFYPVGQMFPDYPFAIADSLGFDWNGDLVTIGAAPDVGYFDRALNLAGTAQLSDASPGDFTLTPSISTLEPGAFGFLLAGIGLVLLTRFATARSAALGALSFVPAALLCLACLLGAPASRAQTQLPCPVRTDQSLTSGDYRNAARCNLYASVAISSGVTFSNEDVGLLLVGDDQQPPVYNGLLYNDGEITNGGGITIEPISGTLINAGTLNNYLGFVVNYNTLLNTGTLNNETGALDNSAGTLTNNGTLTVGGISGAMLQNGATLNNNSVLTALSGGELINLNGGVLNNTYLLSVSSGGTLINETGATLTNSNLVSNAGVLDNTGTLDNSYVLNEITGSTLTNRAGGVVNNYLDLENSGTITNIGTLENQTVATMNNYGTINNSGGLGNSGGFQIINGGILNNTGSIGNTGGGVFVVAGGGTLNNSGSVVSDIFSSFGTTANSAIVNSGTMSLSGTIVAIAGTLRNDGAITTVGGFVPGGDIPIFQPAPILYITATGRLSGTGVVNGVVESHGIVAPGDSPGTLTINGDYYQDADGILDILLGGADPGEYSELDVTGSAYLNGTLDLTMIDGFTPASGDDFSFLLFGQEMGNFSSVVFTNWTCPDEDTCTDAFANGRFSLDVSGPGSQPALTPESPSWIFLVAGLVGLLLLVRKRPVAAR